MGEVILQALLGLLASLAPQLGTSAAIQNVINTLITILPKVIEAFKSLVPHVKEIISILSSNPATLPDQLVTLQQMSAQCDADFDAAADKAAAEDAAAQAAGQ